MYYFQGESHSTFLTGTTCRTLQNTYHYSGSMANGSEAVNNAEIRGGSRVQQPAVTQGNTEGGNAVITDAPATRLRVHKGISMANSKLETSHVILTALIYYTRGGREEEHAMLCYYYHVKYVSIFMILIVLKKA